MAVFDITAMSARSVEEAKEVSDLIFKAVTEDKELSSLYSLVTGIEFDKKIPIIGTLSDIMVSKGADCVFPEGGEILVAEKVWTPKTALQEQRLCKDATEAKFKFWQNNNSNLVERYDLTNSGELNYLIYLVTEALKKAVIRIADFSELLADNVSGGGRITNGKDANLMNVVDGFWYQIFAICTAAPEQLVSISENGLASKALQLALSSTTAKDTFEAMVLAGKDEIRDDETGVLMCTRSLFDNYRAWLIANSFDVAVATQDGFKTMTLKK